MLNWIDIKQDSNDYYIKMPPYDTVGMLPLDAAIHTVNYITNNYPEPYILMLSGGVDSQAMLYAWHKSRMPYQTYSGVYNDNLNENDLCTMREFSKLHNIPVNFQSFDLLNFLQKEHFDYVEKYRCGSPHMTTFMKLSEMIPEGTVIMSGDFKTTNSQISNSAGGGFTARNNFGLYRYAKIKKRSMVPYFFTETRELFYSFYEQFLLRPNDFSKFTKMKNVDEFYNRKIEWYQKNNFPVIPQPMKLTGFELVKDYYDEHFSHLVTAQDRLVRKGGYQNSTRTFDMLLRNKFEVKFQVDKYVIL